MRRAPCVFVIRNVARGRRFVMGGGRTCGELSLTRRTNRRALPSLRWKRPPWGRVPRSS